MNGEEHHHMRYALDLARPHVQVDPFAYLARWRRARISAWKSGAPREWWYEGSPPRMGALVVHLANARAAYRYSSRGVAMILADLLLDVDRELAIRDEPPVRQCDVFTVNRAMIAWEGNEASPLPGIGVRDWMEGCAISIAEWSAGAVRVARALEVADPKVIASMRKRR